MKYLANNACRILTIVGAFVLGGVISTVFACIFSTALLLTRPSEPVRVPTHMTTRKIEVRAADVNEGHVQQPHTGRTTGDSR